MAPAARLAPPHGGGGSTFPPQVWAWVIGSLCGILATLNPHATAFRNTMDELNYFMHAAYHPCIPPDLP